METLKHEGTYTYYPSRNIRWGAIFGGWIVATAAALIFYAVGAALGINVIQVTELDLISKKSIFLTAAWLLVSWTAALYFGGFFASRSVRDSNVRTGALHAVAVWAVSNVLTIFLGVGGVGVTGLTGIMAAGQAGDAISRSMLAATPFAARAIQNAPNAPADFQAQVKNGVSEIIAERGGAAGVDAGTLNQSVENLNAETVLAISSDFLRGGPQAAKNSLTLHTQLSAAEADRLVNSLSQKTEETKAQIKETAQKAATYTASALWVSVAISLLSLLAAVLGGRAGALNKLARSNAEVYRESTSVAA